MSFYITVFCLVFWFCVPFVFIVFVHLGFAEELSVCSTTEKLKYLKHVFENVIFISVKFLMGEFIQSVSDPI